MDAKEMKFWIKWYFFLSFSRWSASYRDADIEGKMSGGRRIRKRKRRRGQRKAGGGREAGQRNGRLVTWAKLHSLGGYKSGYYRAMR